MKDLLEKIRKHGIYILVEENNLKLKFDSNNIPQILIDEIKSKKQEIISYLQSKNSTKTAFSSIPVVQSRQYYELSSSQKRLWILSQFESGNVAYNMSGMEIFEGSLNSEILSASFSTLIERHESLRTVFKEDSTGEIKQWILLPHELGFKLEIVDVEENHDQESVVKQIVQQEIEKPFDLKHGPLIRAKLLKLGTDKYVFTYTIHHIISDGWSMDVLIKELLILYNSYIKGRSNPLKALRIQYKDYSCWQQEQLSGEKLRTHKGYWLKQFEGTLPVLEMPTDKPRPAIKTYNGHIVGGVIKKEKTQQLKSLLQQTGSTMFMGLLAVVKTLLYRYTQQTDIIIGSPIAGREHVDLEDQIGFYVNTLALRTRFKGEDTYTDLLKNIKQVTLEAYEHQVYPFDELVENLNLQRNLSRSALFDIMVVLQNTDRKSIEQASEKIKDIKSKSYSAVESATSIFDLTFFFTEVEDEIHLSIQYNTDLYNRSTVEKIAGYIDKLIESSIKFPDKPINKIDFLSNEERNKLLKDFNDTKITYSDKKTLVDFFEEQALHNPEAIALEYKENKFTYKELNHRSNQFADYLRIKYKIQANDLIGINLERSEHMIIAMLAALKSGGAYVPIDKEYPQERITYILNDSKCKLLIDDEELNKFNEQKAGYDHTNKNRKIKPNDLAYIIYTSGSTGNPKGVMIEHKNVSAFVNWCIKEFNTSDFDVVFGVTSICFDLSIFEIFYTFSVGKKLRLLENAMSITDNIKLNENILLNTVPSVVGNLIDKQFDFNKIKVLNMAGEPIPAEYIEHFNLENMEVRNLYGPSEDTTYSTMYRIMNNSKILIGKPISNTKVYILNEDQMLMPLGAVGEICISGDGLAKGYLYKTELTNEKFITNVFDSEERIYRTGDLGKWLADGNIEYIGRKDDQVKIRGYRIEVGEIEASFKLNKKVEDVVVIAKKLSGSDKELIAYLVSNEALNINDLKSKLSKNLPSFMIPGYYIQLDKIPLTPNGKINKQALPDPQDAALINATKYKAPENEIERKLVDIWSEILVISKDRIGINDNFFDLGGHSLKAIRAITQITKEFGVSLKAEEIFNNSNIEFIAKKIARSKWLAESMNQSMNQDDKIVI